MIPDADDPGSSVLLVSGSDDDRTDPAKSSSMRMVHRLSETGIRRRNRR